jgi:hypothetical protein
VQHDDDGHHHPVEYGQQFVTVRAAEDAVVVLHDGDVVPVESGGGEIRVSASAAKVRDYLGSVDG